MINELADFAEKRADEFGLELYRGVFTPADDNGVALVLGHFARVKMTHYRIVCQPSEKERGPAKGRTIAPIVSMQLRCGV
jgi:hypothetical protein